MSKKISSIKLIFVMLVITIFCATILAVVYKITKNPIEDAKYSAELKAIKSVIVTDFNNNPYAERFSLDHNRIELYPARQDNIVTSIAIKTYTDNGFGGTIEIIAGFLMDGTITGYEIISHQETPGLGTKAWEGKFHDSILGRNVAKNDFNITQDGGDIDAVTGATISSRAVVEAIKRAHDAYTKFTKRSESNEQQQSQ